MKLSEYSPERSDLINKMIMPHSYFPANIKFLWYDNAKNLGDICSENVKPHSHSFFEVIFVAEGKVTYKLNDSEIEIDEGNFILLSPNILHSISASTENAYKISLAFMIDEKSELYNNIVSAKKKKANYAPEMNDIFNFILLQSEENDFFTPALIRGKLLEITYFVLKTLNIKIPENTFQTCDARTQLAKEYIEKNKNRLLSGGEVASVCNLSLKQLNRLFVSDTGITLYDYITECKLKEAKKLLLDENQSIKEIAFSLGFESESSFSSFFKRHSGLSAGAFKKHCTLCRDNDTK